MKSKEKLPKLPIPDTEEWDPREGMGILPEGISLTQNIGCVGKPRNKKPVPTKNEENSK
ncbi:hypothetical protein [Algoriphagus confluentis]|uniref:hypothetical protein n=1 Tax=Algoriphagus confluentis TaxID=1697556 RepID=UPI0030C762A9